MEFRNICGDCNDTRRRCCEFAFDENQSNRNICCCGHMKNMHKSATTLLESMYIVIDTIINKYVVVVTNNLILLINRSWSWNFSKQFIHKILGSCPKS